MNALEVDCTQFTVTVLTAANIGRVCTELPNKLANVLPVIQVVRIGGPNDSVILDIPTIALHGYAVNQKAANQLLHAAYGVMLAALGVVHTIDGQRAVMSRCRNLGGPSWAAYENTDLRHAVSIIQPRIKIA